MLLKKLTSAASLFHWMAENKKLFFCKFYVVKLYRTQESDETEELYEEMYCKKAVVTDHVQNIF